MSCHVTQAYVLHQETVSISTKSKFGRTYPVSVWAILFIKYVWLTLVCAKQVDVGLHALYIKRKPARMRSNEAWSSFGPEKHQLFPVRTAGKRCCNTRSDLASMFKESLTYPKMIFVSLSASCHDRFLQNFPRHTLTVKSKQSLVIWLLPFTVHVFITAQTDSLHVSSADVRSMPHTLQQEAAQCNALEVVYITLQREEGAQEAHHDPDPCSWPVCKWMSSRSPHVPNWIVVKSNTKKGLAGNFRIVTLYSERTGRECVCVCQGFVIQHKMCHTVTTSGICMSWSISSLTVSKMVKSSVTAGSNMCRSHKRFQGQWRLSACTEAVMVPDRRYNV